MFESMLGVVAGGALLGLFWMLATAPAVVAARSGNGSRHVLRRDVRDAWVIAYVAGVLSYVALRLAGIIAH